jgi:hypothetical protein
MTEVIAHSRRIPEGYAIRAEYYGHDEFYDMRYYGVFVGRFMSRREAVSAARIREGWDPR